MKRFETFSPAIPDSQEHNGIDELPPFVEPSSQEVAKKVAKNNKAKRDSQNKAKEKKEVETRVSFFTRGKEILTGKTTRWILGLLFSFFAVYLAIAFLSYFSTCVVDQSEINNTTIGSSADVANAAGEGGARLSEFLINEFFGLGSFVIIVWFLFIGLKLLSGRPKFKTVNFTIKCIVALVTLSLIVGLLTISLQSTVNWGGYHGRYVNEFIIHFLGWSGAVILCIFIVCCFVLICMRDVVKWAIKIKKQRDEIRRIKKEEELLRLERERELEEMRLSENEAQGITPENTIKEGEENISEAVHFDGEDQGIYSSLPDFEDGEFTSYDLEEEKENSPEEIQKDNQEDDHDKDPSEIKNNPSGENIMEEDNQNSSENSGESASEDNMPISQQEDTKGNETVAEGLNQDSSQPSMNMVVNVNAISQVAEKKPAIASDSPEHFPYNFPPFSLVREGEVKVSVDEEEQLENQDKIRKTLLDFDIPIVNIEATVGPTVTLYEIVPDKGIRVNKIRSLVDDIALSLSAEGVRIIAPIPGKGTVGIEVANKDPQTVSMRTVLKSKTYQETSYKLPIAMGSTISNEVYIADLAKMPHLLVAGATGQGKSVGLNAIIASLLYSKRPDELKFVMIDPKMVEFSLYAKIEGHYLAKIPDAEDAIITDMDKVVATLSSLCIEMDNRYQLLKNAGARNIIEYNDKIKAKKLNPEEGHRFLPYIVVIVDEFSDLIMTAGKEVEVPIARLAQKARAVGMHVIIATQRPSTNVITGIIKANFPARIAFKVSSGVDSKTILDTTGAQQLIGRGDMLVSNSAPMVRVQCAFIDTPEVEKICEHISRQPYAQGAYLLPEPISKGDNDGDAMNGYGGERDPLFEEVARLVVTSNNASTSSLQRRYSIGYNRAGKIMDQLEAAGIVGPAQGGKPRAVLMDPVSLDLLLES
ncbi:MAG: DNA translocase FtsK [Muribaculaceae bacterium]|nr:DNA translocase FtsK [Muribaculaceae bacterium]